MLNLLYSFTVLGNERYGNASLGVTFKFWRFHFLDIV